MYLRKHPDGPELSASVEEKYFRSYADMASWAEENLPRGKYYVYNKNGVNLATKMREVRSKIGEDGLPRTGGFWVEGRSYI